MKIIQTFWSGPATPGHTENNPLHNRAGWLSPEYHWMSWALSCLQLCKLYGQVTLVTDDAGKHILVDLLKLPYTSVNTSLQNRLGNYPPQLWSLAKIHSFSIQQQPFMHFDGDVFVWHRFEDSFMQAPVAAQNLEVNIPWYREMIAELEQHFTFLPDALLQHRQQPDIFAANTGVFGGYDIDFIQQYCAAAFELVDRNLERLPQVKLSHLNFIYEQCLLYYLAAGSGRPISYLMDEPVDEPSYMDYARFADVPDVKLIHTVGGYKTMPYTCSHLARRLRRDYPDYYYRVIELCRQGGVELHMGLYNRLAFTPGGEPGQRIGAVADTGSGDMQALYARTLAALKYTGSQPGTAAVDAAALEAAAAAVNSTEQRQRIQEILSLEMHRQQLFARLLNDEAMTALYLRQRSNYRKTDEIFSGPEEALLSSMVRLDDAVWFRKLSSSWEQNGVEDPEQLAAQSLNAEAEELPVLLFIDAAALMVIEAYPEPLEAVIVEACTQPVTVSALLKELEQYFDAAEIEAGYGLYQKLVLDNIRQLCHSGILAPC